MDFVIEKINAILGSLAGAQTENLGFIEGFEVKECGYNQNFEELSALSDFKPFLKYDRLLGEDVHYCLKAKLKTPEKEANKKLFLSVRTGREGQWDGHNPQGLVYLDGKIIQGLDVNHTRIPLEFNKEYDILIYLYTGMLNEYIVTGTGGTFPYEAAIDFIPEYHIVDERIEKLYYDIKVPFESAKCFSEKDENFILIMEYLNKAVGMLNLLVPKSEEFFKGIEKADAFLEKEFYGKVCGSSDQTVTCIGHTHIDVAWLWTVNQTREKVQRSFATAISLMKQYPEFKFMSSQPQLYDYVKNDAPQLYEEIKKAVKDGRWEAEGGMWLEADCNLTSGEGFVRQILHGKRFMQKEFGVDNKILWMPDVFGYSAALPQIMNKTGLKYFITTKIGCNETNTMPYDSFIWQGIDGSQVFTSFLGAQELPPDGKFERGTTYAGMIYPSQIIGTWKRYQQKQYTNEAIIAFGHADGGGGPTIDMLEQYNRLKKGIPGIPKTKIDFSYNFFERVYNDYKKRFEETGKITKWVGELYLEFHRGTYTSMAKNKRNNRKSELLYQKAETLSVIDNLLLNNVYPKETLNKNWKVILLNQFHDILPGSAIKPVYEVTDKEYKEVLDVGNDIVSKKLGAITSNIKTDGGLFVYNPNGFSASTVVDKDNEKVYVENIPAFGYKVVDNYKNTNSITFKENVLDTPFYIIEFDKAGNIISLFDKENLREVANGKFGEFEIFEDFPKAHDAWEISCYYKDKVYTIDECEITGRPFGSAFEIEIKRNFLDSVITQKMYVYENIRRIDFDTVIDWKQEHQLMKIAFPTTVQSDTASYDIQFGHVKRPTHSNTSWDKAKFEVCAHKWADISDTGYGVSIINDCKYGYSAEGGCLKLTVLKSATCPNPDADREIHTFSYSVYPHSGDVTHSNLITESYLFNCPLSSVELSKQDGILNDEFSLISADKENIIIETVKCAEDSDDIIVRLYESFNRKTLFKLKFGFDVKKAFICDMLENEEQELLVSDNEVSLHAGNFEVITLKLIK